MSDVVEMLFTPAGPRSGKLRCRVCGRTGWALSREVRGWPGHWMNGCRRGHAPCARGCGKQLALRKNGMPMAHSRCPKVAADA